MMQAVLASVFMTMHGFLAKGNMLWLQFQHEASERSLRWTVDLSEGACLRTAKLLEI